MATIKASQINKIREAYRQSMSDPDGPGEGAAQWLLNESGSGFGSLDPRVKATLENRDQFGGADNTLKMLMNPDPKMFTVEQDEPIKPFSSMGPLEAPKHYEGDITSGEVLQQDVFTPQNLAGMGLGLLSGGAAASPAIGGRLLALAKSSPRIAAALEGLSPAASKLLGELPGAAGFAAGYGAADVPMSPNKSTEQRLQEGGTNLLLGLLPQATRRKLFEVTQGMPLGIRNLIGILGEGGAAAGTAYAGSGEAEQAIVPGLMGLFTGFLGGRRRGYEGAPPTPEQRAALARTGVDVPGSILNPSPELEWTARSSISGPGMQQELGQAENALSQKVQEYTRDLGLPPLTPAGSLENQRRAGQVLDQVNRAKEVRNQIETAPVTDAVGTTPQERMGVVDTLRQHELNMPLPDQISSIGMSREQVRAANREYGRAVDIVKRIDEEYARRGQALAMRTDIIRDAIASDRQVLRTAIELATDNLRVRRFLENLERNVPQGPYTITELYEIYPEINNVWRKIPRTAPREKMLLGRLREAVMQTLEEGGQRYGSSQIAGVLQRVNGLVRETHQRATVSDILVNSFNPETEQFNMGAFTRSIRENKNLPDPVKRTALEEAALLHEADTTARAHTFPAGLNLEDTGIESTRALSDQARIWERQLRMLDQPGQDTLKKTLLKRITDQTRTNGRFDYEKFLRVREQHPTVWNTLVGPALDELDTFANASRMTNGIRTRMRDTLDSLSKQLTEGDANLLVKRMRDAFGSNPDNWGLINNILRDTPETLQRVREMLNDGIMNIDPVKKNFSIEEFVKNYGELPDQARDFIYGKNRRNMDAIYELSRDFTETRKKTGSHLMNETEEFRRNTSKNYYLARIAANTAGATTVGYAAGGSPGVAAAILPAAALSYLEPWVAGRIMTGKTIGGMGADDIGRLAHTLRMGMSANGTQKRPTEEGK